MYHWSIEKYSYPEFLSASFILIFLSEPCARCGMKLAWASNQTGSDCVT